MIEALLAFICGTTLFIAILILRSNKQSTTPQDSTASAIKDTLNELAELKKTLIDSQQEIHHQTAALGNEVKNQVQAQLIKLIQDGKVILPEQALARKETDWLALLNTLPENERSHALRNLQKQDLIKPFEDYLNGLCIEDKFDDLSDFDPKQAIALFTDGIQGIFTHQQDHNNAK
jgi:hypothetical protein